jgi:DNA-binding transcriptional MerR regulator
VRRRAPSDLAVGIIPIGVAAEIIGVEPHVLRIYERKGVIRPSRSDGNRRLYSLADLELLEYVHFLTHVRKVNLPGVLAMLELLDKLPEEIRRSELASVERAIDQLDATAREIFAKGSATVERVLLDENAESMIHRQAEGEVAGRGGEAAAAPKPEKDPEQ